ncbi:MAG TPA: Rieske (2Fe-2S) protein [Candidatus Acidoferrum sp.]|nr:Rieske (2Fe-2S) protein [Candidatus Methylomirabilis sp.]HWU38186.1 Rieske (2Fe-2S) protein [Candidatus Acidoferrum sp.]
MRTPGLPSEGLDEKRLRLSRRFLLGTGWCGFLIATLGPALANVRYLFPNVVYEGPTRFKVGRPEEYPVGSATFLEEQRLFVLHDPEGFRALSAVCTHLRCTVGQFVPPDAQWKESHARCPCHGSIFAKDGRVLQGPAPRPLDFYRVSLAPDGRLLVETVAIVGRDYALKV